MNIEERLDALDKTNELLFEQNNDTGADLDALAESVDVIANKTADKFGEVVGAMNKNFETLTEFQSTLPQRERQVTIQVLNILRLKYLIREPEKLTDLLNY